MTGQLVTLGPFIGGLNNAANTPDTIEDNELFVCQDFDYNIDQTLVTRPTVARETGSGTSQRDVYVKILGSYITPTYGEFQVAKIGTDLYFRSSVNSSWTLITSGFGNATCGVQYGDRFYVAKNTAGGGYWVYAGSGSGTWTPVSAFPAVSTVAVFKDRLWASSITNYTRLVFSALGDPTTWNSSDFIDINSGDGQKLVNVTAGTSALYLFKENSTFVFTYDSAPTRGFVQNISTTIGAKDSNSVTTYQSQIYVLHGVRVYVVEGYTFNRLSTKVSLDRGSSGSYPEPYTLSTVGDRIICTFLNNTYVYYPLTNTWTEWKISPVGKWWEWKNSLSVNGYRTFSVSINSATISGNNMLTLRDREWQTGDGVDYSTTDPIIVTKMYPMGGPQGFKRLHWWGIDAIINNSTDSADARLVLLPYNFSSYQTWNLLKNMTWGQAGLSSWDDLEGEVGGVPTNIRVTSKDRKYIKADRSVRFPRIQFKVQLKNYDHTRRSSINHIIASISAKQTPVSRNEGTRL